MPEYIEREALKKRIRLLPRLAPYNSVFYSSVQKAIFDVPTADVVEVVRCKDCQHARQTVYGNYHCLVDHRLAHEETDYCSYGERKEGAEE